jgi:hypothetical protein
MRLNTAIAIAKGDGLIYSLTIDNDYMLDCPQLPVRVNIAQATDDEIATWAVEFALPNLISRAQKPN